VTRENLFTPSELRIYNKLSTVRGKDVKVSVLFRALTGRWPQDDEPHRYQQQRIGSIICRMNAKLLAKRMKAAPGITRQTYRLTRI